MPVVAGLYMQLYAMVMGLTAGNVSGTANAPRCAFLHTESVPQLQ